MKRPHKVHVARVVVHPENQTSGRKMNEVDSKMKQIQVSIWTQEMGQTAEIDSLMTMVAPVLGLLEPSF